MKKYYILWNFGVHSRWCRTTKKDYNLAILDMMEEFTIYHEDKKMKVKTFDNKEKIIEWHNAYIYNYYGDKYIFAGYEK